MASLSNCFMHIGFGLGKAMLAGEGCYMQMPVIMFPFYGASLFDEQLNQRGLLPQASTF